MPECAIVTAALAIIQSVRDLRGRVDVLVPTIALPANLSTLCGDGGGLIYRIYHNVVEFVTEAGEDVSEPVERPITPEVQQCHTGPYLYAVQAWIDGIQMQLSGCPPEHTVTISDFHHDNITGVNGIYTATFEDDVWTFSEIEYTYLSGEYTDGNISIGYSTSLSWNIILRLPSANTTVTYVSETTVSDCPPVGEYPSFTSSYPSGGGDVDLGSASVSLGDDA
jgi:hypothetical protein